MDANVGGWIGVTELGKAFGVDRKVCAERLAAAGVYRSPVTKQYPREEAVAAIMATTDLNASVGNIAAGRGQNRVNEKLDDPEVRALMQLKRAKLEQEAEKLRLANEQARGNMIDRKVALDTFGAVIKRAQGIILATVHDIANDGANLGVDDLRDVAEKHLRLALESLSATDAVLDV